MARRYYVLAALLVVVGAAGFMVPSPLFGALEVSPMLNALHIIAGVLTAVSASRGLGNMRWWGQMLGYAFSALAAAGFLVDSSSAAAWLPLSSGNAWFHLALALVFLYHALLAPPTL